MKIHFKSSCAKFWYLIPARSHGCVQNDIETYETVLLDFTIDEAWMSYE